MMTSAIATSTACTCGSDDTEIREQQFRDGTVHLRESCCRCGRFLRYAPRSAMTEPAFRSRPPASSPAPPMPSDTSARAIDTLGEVSDRAGLLRDELTDASDAPRSLAVLAGAIAARATLSPENLHSLERAIRTGTLPRRERP